ncbi:HipA family kinase [Rubrivirga sp.]|uniref:HipA family kinase n=1 Tax=Rubrivirga sp. TaxID=1885344 RepID=UPI003C781B09
MLPTHTAQRYAQPLREGGSLPALVETDAGLEVVKFRGAGQGARALLAELIVGGIAQALGLPIPTLSVVDVPDGFGRAEPDPEIQDILKGSVGANVGLAFVPGAFAYEHAAHADIVDPDLAADVVWLDALTTNIDRTPRNPNLLVARGDDGPQLWLIDHGAALYHHHNWPSVDTERAQTPFPAIKDHVLLPIASDLEAADARHRHALEGDTLRRVLEDVPDSLLVAAPPGREPDFETAGQARDAYLRFFADRLSTQRWVDQAEHARTTPPDTSALAYRR